VADAKKIWTEASLTCSGELAEAVAEVFARFSPDGVVLVNVTRYDPERHEHIPTGMVRVAAYLPQDEELESKKTQPRRSPLVYGENRAPARAGIHQCRRPGLDDSLEAKLPAAANWETLARFACLVGPS